MSSKKESGSFVSSQGTKDIAYYVYQPEQTPKAMVQICHGMCEYVGRYEEMISYFTERGYLVFGHNHLGHKESVQNKEELGYFAHKNGWIYLYQDTLKMASIMKERYPQLPMFLFGHSMGSFVARCVMTQEQLPYQGVILCGTGGSNPALKAGRLAIHLVRRIKGERYRSKLLTNLSFGNYLSRIKPQRTPYDWISRDTEVVDRYCKDEYCTFIFTVAGYDDLTAMLGYISSAEWYRKVPKDLSVFLMAGQEDPVGNWGKGVEEVYSRLVEEGVTDCNKKLYPGMRHEIHNEIGREQVYEDLFHWITSHLPQD